LVIWSRFDPENYTQLVVFKVIPGLIRIDKIIA
jgi:hypothetical protein